MVFRTGDDAKMYFRKLFTVTKFAFWYPISPFITIPIFLLVGMKKCLVDQLVVLDNMRRNFHIVYYGIIFVNDHAKFVDMMLRYNHPDEYIQTLRGILVSETENIQKLSYANYNNKIYHYTRLVSEDSFAN